MAFFSAAELRRAGYDLTDLRRALFDISSLQTAGVEVHGLQCARKEALGIHTLRIYQAFCSNYPERWGGSLALRPQQKETPGHFAKKTPWVDLETNKIRMERFL